ncbi:unnamed protein product [Urochloa humidicola]
MEALVVRRLGDPTAAPGGEASPFAAVSEDHPLPELSSPTAVRVRVAATSLNFATFLQVQGKYQERPPLPFVPGSDYAGVIDAVGPGVRGLRPGDRVCSFAGLGSFADFIVAEEKQLFVVPDGCDLVAAGALPVAFGTSHLALVHRAQLKAGQNWTIHGLYWGSYSTHWPQVLIDSLNELLSWLSKGLITVQISHRYRLAEAHLAFAALRDRKAVGKVMIVMGSSAKSRL